MSRKDWTSEKIFGRLLNNKTQKTFWENIREIRSRPTKKVYQYAYKLSNSSLEKEQIIGIYVLAQLGYHPRMNKKKTLKLYFDLLKTNPTPKLLEALLSSIAHNNDSLSKSYISELIKFRYHNYSDVRFQLTLALSGIEHEKAIETLIFLSTDKHSDVRDYATWSLGTQLDINSEKIINALWNRITDSDESTRFEAIYGLSKRKDIRIKEMLKKELEDINNNGSQILESIEELNDPEFISLIKEQIKKNKTTKQVNEKWLLKTLKILKNKR